jgi:ACR3 family arsenite transporter
MLGESCVIQEPKGLGLFEKYLTVGVFLCIGLGILLGRFAPETAQYLDALPIYIGEASVVSIPIAICLFS